MQRSGSRFSTRNLARTSSRHPKTVIGIWVAVLVGSLLLNVAIGADALTNEFAFTNAPDSQVARDLVDERFGSSFQEVVVVQSETLTVDDPAFQARVESLFEIMVGHEGFEPIADHYYVTGNLAFVSADRRTLIMPFTVSGTLDETTELVEPVFDDIVEQNGEGGFLVAIVGESAQVALDPTVMGLGPVPAVEALRAKNDLTVDDYDLIELNEAFAAQVLACHRDLDLPMDRVNVNGGAIALGHPIGATGARIVVTLLHELKRRGGSNGLATLCISGGMGLATRFHRNGL